MGKHSMPDPEGSANEPSDEHAADYPDLDPWEDIRYPGVLHGPADPWTAGLPADYSYPSTAHSADDDRPYVYHTSEDRFFDDKDQYSNEDLYAASESDYPPAGDYAARADDEYPDFPPQPTSSKPMTAPPPLFRTGRRGLRDWKGDHRRYGGRRGVSISVIVALVMVVVVVAGVILWRFFGDTLSHRSHTAAARCVGGKDTVAVIADPSIADPVKELADSYNTSASPIGDRCVSVTVKPAGSDAVIAGFIGKWPSELGDHPGLWIPGSSISAARLAGTTGQKTIRDRRSLVTSPVLLTIRPEFQQALANQNWATLPSLQANPNSLAGLNLPTWGSLRLALPLTDNSDASYLAGEAIAAASAPAGASPTAGVDAVRSLMSAQPKLADNSLTEALNALLNIGAVAAAPVHAVITTEQRLFQRGQSMSDAKGKLSFWLPPGPVAVADYPTVLLSGSWLSQEQTTAASVFAHFMHKPEQLAKLAKAGFRVNGVQPPSSPVTSFPALAGQLSVGDDDMRVTLANTMATSSAGVATTIMLDQSMPTDDGGETRLANVVAALNNRIKALPSASVLGLWTFDGREGRAEVPTGPLADPVGDQPRAEALAAALDKQYSSAGGAVSFTTLRMIYQDALAFQAGQNNSVLVITTGPHTDQSLDGPGLQDFIRRSVDPAKPVTVNVIDFGSDPDRATWEAVAQLSGGSYKNLATSASPDLVTAINTFLS